MKFKVNKFLSIQLSKFQQNRLGEKQTQLIDEWFNEKEAAENKPQVLLEDNSKTELQEALFTKILEGIAKENVKHWYQYNGLKVAVLLLVLSSVSFLLFMKKGTLEQNQVTYQIYETHNGEVKKITLPDGSSIWMNAATLIKVPQKFTSFKTREIKLEQGEAFFQVKRDTLKPFQIKTGKYLTTVLGTSFNIRSYPGESSYQVAVITGKVKVEKMMANRLQLLSGGLIKGQALNFDEQTNQSVIKKRDTENLMAWTSSKNLFLENMSLIQIGKALERQYGIPVEVHLGNEERLKYTIAFSEPEIKGAIKQLALKTGINYQLTNHSLIIKTNR
jgi:transmembrane sensor